VIIDGPHFKALETCLDNVPRHARSIQRFREVEEASLQLVFRAVALQSSDCRIGEVFTETRAWLRTCSRINCFAVAVALISSNGFRTQ